jgi:hypothetical protein
MATNFSFEGLLGGINNAFGGGSSDYLDEYLTPEQRRMMQRNAMLSASAALLKAGGESTRRIGIGEALGEALQAGQAGYEKAQTGALTQMSLKQKMEEAKRAKAFQETIAGVFNQPTPGQAITPDQALAIPGMAAGPTLERAAMIGQPAPEVDARLQKSKQYSTLASIYAAAGKTEEAARMQKLSDELNPRDEVLGGLTQVTDEKGNPIMIQQYKSGRIETAKGFGPPREIVLQNVGGKIIAIDKNRVGTGQEFALGMSPEGQAASLVALERLGMDRTQLDAKLKNDAAQLGINQRQLELAIDAAGLNREKFDRDAYERVETEGGNLFLVSKVPGGASFPILGPSPSPGVAGKQLGVGITPVQQATIDLNRDLFGLRKEQFGLSKDQFAQKVKQDDAQLSISLQQLGLSKDQFAQKVKQDALSMGIDQQRLGLELKRYNLSAAELARGNYKVQETENGFVYIPTVPGMQTIPITGGGGEPLKGKSEAPAAFSEAAKKLNNLKGNISAYKTEIDADKTVFPSEIPLPFGARIPLPTGTDTARLRGKYQSLLMGVKDLYELGALTGPDMGIISEQLTNPASFAGMFTSRAAMKEQIKVLEDMAARAEENLSSTYKRKIPAASTLGIDGGLTWDPAQKKFVNR